MKKLAMGKLIKLISVYKKIKLETTFYLKFKKNVLFSNILYLQNYSSFYKGNMFGSAKYIPGNHFFWKEVKRNQNLTI
jgi:hypothetical protein